MGSAEVVQELIESSVRERMQEQGAKDVRCNRDGIGAGERAARELLGVARQRGQHVTLDAMHDEKLVDGRDGIHAVVALGIELGQGFLFHKETA